MPQDNYFYYKEPNYITDFKIRIITSFILSNFAVRLITGYIF